MKAFEAVSCIGGKKLVDKISCTIDKASIEEVSCMLISLSKRYTVPCIYFVSCVVGEKSIEDDVENLKRRMSNVEDQLKDILTGLQNKGHRDQKQFQKDQVEYVFLFYEHPDQTI